MYRAPLKDLQFVLHDLIGEADLQACRDLGDYSADLADSVLAEAGRFAESVLDPLYRTGDRDGAKWTPQGVVTPPGYKDAYAQFVEGGWPSLSHSTEYGGQGMPRALATAVEEIWTSANCAFKLCPMLTHSAIEALEQVGAPGLQQTYLPKLISGEWTGTMNLTEPQAGSDLAQVRMRAVPEGDHYRLFGQKIFITYGEHDFTPNIVHLTLARIDGAPGGVKGISLFVVPKFLPRADGSPGERNDVHCLSIEHKLGIHASPTCVMAYGQKDGAIGYLVGEANAGLKHMFIMMNAARLAVGLEGYALAERAFQQAAQWARTRVQGKPPVAAADGPAHDHSSSRREAHAADDEVAHGSDACAGAVRGVLARPRRPSSRQGVGGRRSGARGVADSDREGLEHGVGHRSDFARHPGPRRHGLRRGDWRGAAVSRRAHLVDLRRHDRHPGERPVEPQARARPGRDDQLAACRSDA